MSKIRFIRRKFRYHPYFLYRPPKSKTKGYSRILRVPKVPRVSFTNMLTQPLAQNITEQQKNKNYSASKSICVQESLSKLHEMFEEASISQKNKIVPVLEDKKVPIAQDENLPVPLAKISIPETKYALVAVYPQNSNIPLGTHQMDAIQFVYHCYHTLQKECVLLDMTLGCGKTRVPIEFVNLIQKKALIITKNTITAHIKNEVKKWLPSNNALIDVLDPLSFRKHVSPESLTDYTVIVIDECHLIASKKSHATVKFLRQVKLERKQKLPFLILLSGTSGNVEDQLDLMNLFDSSANELNVFHYSWSPKYTPKTQIVKIPLNQEQQAMHEQFKCGYDAINPKDRFHAYQKMREMLSRWKTSIVRDFCLKATCSVLVVSEFKTVLIELDMLLPPHVKRHRIDATTKLEKRYDYVQMLQQGKIQVLLACTNAIAHGLNLGKTNLLILFEPNYLANAQKQTSGRLTRLDCENPNQLILNLMFENSIEDRLYNANFCSGF